MKSMIFKKISRFQFVFTGAELDLEAERYAWERPGVKTGKRRGTEPLPHYNCKFYS